MALPSKFSWLEKENAPHMLVEAISHYGILEHTGPGSNPDILAWATEVGVRGWYADDDIPWCGLFVGICAKRAGYPIKSDLLSALSWANFGEKIPKGREMLWDILVFSRAGGGHVGFYVGENASAFLVYGGNQANAVGFAWVSKERLVAAVRPNYKIGEPANVRKIILTDSGDLSTNEQ